MNLATAHFRHHLAANAGQTTVEWLLLMSVAFITSYIMITGPLARYTKIVLLTFGSNVKNVVQNGELEAGNLVPAGQPGHPSDPTRYKYLHR
jgi:hypothetical protein